MEIYIYTKRLTHLHLIWQSLQEIYFDIRDMLGQAGKKNQVNT